MCIHIHRQLLDELDFWHREGVTNVSGVQMYSRTGRFVGSWVCFFDQPQSVAQAVHALRTWHPGDANIVSLDLVNEMRYDLGPNLPSLKLAGLPAPQPLAAEGLNDDDSRSQAATRFMVTQWLHNARAAAYVRA